MTVAFTRFGKFFNRYINPFYPRGRNNILRNDSLAFARVFVIGIVVDALFHITINILNIHAAFNIFLFIRSAAKSISIHAPLLFWPPPGPDRRNVFFFKKRPVLWVSFLLFEVLFKFIYAAYFFVLSCLGLCVFAD